MKYPIVQFLLNYNILVTVTILKKRVFAPFWLRNKRKCSNSENSSVIQNLFLCLNMNPIYGQKNIKLQLLKSEKQQPILFNNVFNQFKIIPKSWMFVYHLQHINSPIHTPHHTFISIDDKSWGFVMDKTLWGLQCLSWGAQKQTISGWTHYFR